MHIIEHIIMQLMISGALHLVSWCERSWREILEDRSNRHFTIVRFLNYIPQAIRFCGHGPDPKSIFQSIKLSVFNSIK